MVKIVDGYKERSEELNKHNALVELARKYFEGKRIDASSNNSIIVRQGFTGCDVEIYSRSIDVHKKSYFESARRFAEEAEKVMGREFILSTTYEL